MSSRVWAELRDGRRVHAHTIGHPDGPQLTLLEWGATVQTLRVPVDGEVRQVVLGHPDLETYLASTHYLGATIGRYANRIAGGRFEVDGVGYEVPVNDRGNNLHGGPEGFDRQLWSTHAVTATYAEMGLVSPHGHQGFPGRVTATARFEVVGDEVRLTLTAHTDAPTPVSLTNHSYFNLDGEGAGTVEEHLLQVHADAYTPVDGTGIPTGEVTPVAGPFDWREPTRLGAWLDDPALEGTGGLDHNLVVRGEGMRPVAALVSSDRRLRLDVHGDRPGVQVYSGNKLDGALPDTAGRPHVHRGGIALEVQAFPDAPNRPGFPPTVLRPREEYVARTTWRLTAT